jgi:glucoamylase
MAVHLTASERRQLRLELLAPARARISLDGWRSWFDVEARDTSLGVWVVDVPDSDHLSSGDDVDFTFWWPEAGRWEERDFRVTVQA